MKTNNNVYLTMNLIEDTYKQIIKYYSGEYVPKIRYTNHPDGTISIWVVLKDNYCDFEINWDEDNPGLISIYPINIKHSFIDKSAHRLFLRGNDTVDNLATRIDDILQDYL